MHLAAVVPMIVNPVIVDFVSLVSGSLLCCSLAATVAVCWLFLLQLIDAAVDIFVWLEGSFGRSSPLLHPTPWAA